MATVTTKFEVGQKVFFIEDNKVKTDKIEFINISVGQWRKDDKDTQKILVEYALKDHYKDHYHPILHKEDRLFLSPEGLSESVKDQAKTLQTS